MENKLSSYQKRKRDIAYLEQCIWELEKKAEFFQRAIWETRKATGEHLGVEPFNDLCSNEESPIVSDKNGLLKLIRELPLSYNHPGFNRDDFLTSYNFS